MKYVSYRTPSGDETWGVLVDERIFNLGPSGTGLAPSLQAAVESHIFGSSTIDWKDAPSYDVSDVQFLPAIPEPGKIICIGVNYRSHQDEIGKPPPSGPTVFTRFADTQIGHNAPAIFPREAEQFDYEGELALVIGKDAHHISKEAAFDVIAGYAVYNDFSVRDWQRFSSQWTPGKNFPGTGAFGPYLIPASEIGDVEELLLETRVNGEVRQSALVKDLIFDIPSLLEFVTTFTKLSPGDVVVTGTPGGVGLYMDPQRLLSEGDVVEVEISGLGVLRNSVQRAS